MHELAVKVRPHVVVHVALLFLHLPGLVTENCVLVPSLAQRVGGVDQGVSLQQFGLSVGH